MRVADKTIDPTQSTGYLPSLFAPNNEASNCYREDC